MATRVGGDGFGIDFVIIVSQLSYCLGNDILSTYSYKLAYWEWVYIYRTMHKGSVKRDGTNTYIRSGDNLYIDIYIATISNLLRLPHRAMDKD